MKKIAFALMMLVAWISLAAEMNCCFVKDQWKPEQWLLVKSPRWSYIGSWIQKEDSIQNAVPENKTPIEMQGKFADQTFTSMLWKEPITSKHISFTATMSFDYRMAPEMILSCPVKNNENGYPQYAEYWEIVLYDEGLNVWHHEIKDGKPYWRKAAFVNAKFLPRTKYTMTVEVQMTAKCPMLTISCNGVKFGCMLPTLPSPYYIGITGCEGINHFYDFSVRY